MKKQAGEGIFIGRNSRGYFFRIKQNQHILVFAGGYDTKQNAEKGLMGLSRILKSTAPIADLNIIDLTLKKKPL